MSAWCQNNVRQNVKEYCNKKDSVGIISKKFAGSTEVDNGVATSKNPELAVAKHIFKRPNKPLPNVILVPVDGSGIMTQSSDLQPQVQGNIPLDSPKGEKLNSKLWKQEV